MVDKGIAPGAGVTWACGMATGATTGSCGWVMAGSPSEGLCTVGWSMVGCWMTAGCCSGGKGVVVMLSWSLGALPVDASPDAWNRLDHTVLRRFAAVVPLWYGTAAMAHGSRARGLTVDSVHGMPAWSELWVGPGPPRYTLRAN